MYYFDLVFRMDYFTNNIYEISNLVHTTRFWNNLHHRKMGKPNNLKRAIKPKGLSRIANITYV